MGDITDIKVGLEAILNEITSFMQLSAELRVVICTFPECSVLPLSPKANTQS